MSRRLFSCLIAAVAAAAWTVPAAAQTVIFQGVITGGVAVDGNGVSTPYDGSTTWYAADEDFDIVIPSTATVTRVYAVLHAKSSSFPVDTAANVAINGLDLTYGTLVDDAYYTQVYELDPAAYGITAAGPVSYEETGAADSGYHGGLGVGGAVLVVLYEDLVLATPRHVTLAMTEMNLTDTLTLGGLPTASGASSAIVSVGILWECSDEQNGSVTLDGLTFPGTGGRDDGATFDTTCGLQDWNSLHTQGSFGYDDTDLAVGADEDDPYTEPATGSATNSRLSDEVWSVDYADVGEIVVDYTETTNDSRLISVVVAIDMADADGDGVWDGEDNCPGDANPDQEDADLDGIGDACDECTDVDGDGFGAPGQPNLCEEDCDDADPAVNPDAAEACDLIDNDCDGEIDEQDAIDCADYLLDADDDGYGVTGDVACLCAPTDPYDATVGGDCDDGAPAVNPAAIEICNGVDDNCDGVADEGFDLDADGFTSCDGDCDDDDPAVNPGAAEICNGADDDCDGDVDEDFDQDGDGFSSCAGDCDDSQPTVYPGAAEDCDSLDNDCDGEADEDHDQDGDGVTVCAGDCDDLAPAVNPGADEICNGIDDDCDGTIDQGALDAQNWYLDDDGDGFGDPGVVESACGPPAGFVAIPGDCDDADAAVNPAADEICNGVDDDCDGTTDELADDDGDGFSLCDGDCDDDDPAAFPGNEEVCDGVDNDCDPATDEDADEDGDGASICDGDCDDDEPASFPGNVEVCDGLDNDCDGQLPIDEVDGDGDGVMLCDGDCDDAEAFTYPGAPEQCDGLDNDCDGEVDEDVDEDLDGDGFNACQGDCDGNDGDVYPGASEICDGKDSDCDGQLPADEADVDGDGWSLCDGDCDDEDAAINPDADEICDDGLDNDCDGDADADDADCEDPGDDDDTTGDDDDDTTGDDDDDTTADSADDDDDEIGGGCDCESNQAVSRPAGLAAVLALLGVVALRRRAG